MTHLETRTQLTSQRSVIARNALHGSDISSEPSQTPLPEATDGYEYDAGDRLAPPAASLSIVSARDQQQSLTASNSVSLHTMFGSFFLGNDEFALVATSIREVVNYPEKITPIPLSLVFLEEIFTLRGIVIPVLNLARIFDPAAPSATRSQPIVIVDYKEIQIGLLFESIGEILRIRPDQCTHLEYRDEGSHNVVSGTIRLKEGARLLQILDPDALISIKNIPQIVALKKTGRQVQGNHFQLQAERRQCLGFRTGGIAFAFEMSAVREIIEVPTMQESVLSNKLCLGRINLRGNVVAIVDFAALLQIEPPTAPNVAERRIVIANIGNTSIGLLVDSVDNLFSFFPGDVLPIPLVSDTRAGMFNGCIVKEGIGEVIFLNHAQIFSKAEVLAITRGHTELYQEKAGESKAHGGTKHTGTSTSTSHSSSLGITADADYPGDTHGAAHISKNRRVYITFCIGATYAFDIAGIREIINYRDDLMRPPSLPTFI